MKQELTLHDVLAAGGVDVEAAEPYNAEQQYSIQKKAQTFLEGTTEDIEEINSIREVNEYLN